MARSRTFAPTAPEPGPIVDDEVGRLFESTQTRDAQPRVRELPTERIEPNPFQARHTLPDLEALAQTIRVQGFTSRLRVRPHPDDSTRFQLIYGERRLRAAVLAGLTRVPVEIVASSDDELIEIGLAENLQRQDLTPLEEAQGLALLMERRGYSQWVVADRLGKTPGYVQNRLDLLRAPADVQQLVVLRPDTLRVARSLARLPAAEQRRPLIDALISGTVTGDAVVVRVRDLLDQAAPPAAASPPSEPPAPADPGIASQDAVDTAAATTPAAAPSLRRGAVRPEPKRSALTRILETDVLRLDVVLSRWRQALARASDDERQAFAAYLRDHLEPQLAALRQAAERDGFNDEDNARGRV